MRADLRLHLIGGFGLVAWTAVVLLVYMHFGTGPMFAAGSTLGAVGVEVYQKVRNDGTPAWDDAAMSAAPGFVAWLFCVGAGIK